MSNYKYINKFSEIHIEESEKEEFENYLSLKGVQRYKIIEETIKDQYKVLTYKTLSEYYRYDIMLRRQLFKCFSLFEESMRAYICNNFEIQNLTKFNFEEQMNIAFRPTIKFKLTSKEKIKLNQIFNDKKTTMSLFDFLESCDISFLTRIILLLGQIHHKAMFEDVTNLEKNLKSLTRLRNSVFHHNLLLGTSYGEISSIRIKGKSLQDNIEYLISLLPLHTRENIKDEFNSCLFINNTDKKYGILEQYSIYFKRG